MINPKTTHGANALFIAASVLIIVYNATTDEHR